jgi:hypothetical protein
MRYIKIAMYFSMMYSLLFSTIAFSEPTPGIKMLIETPASAFDVFLHQLYIASNGPSFFGGPNMKEQLRIYQLNYDYGSNLIDMSFHIGPNHKLMKDFSSKDVEGKKAIMLSAAKDIAKSLGLERNGFWQGGLIHSLKIRNGWSTKNFNESEIKEEIAEHIVLTIVYAWEDELIYQVRRNQSGQYEFSMDTKTIR